MKKETLKWLIVDDVSGRRIVISNVVDLFRWYFIKEFGLEVWEEYISNFSTSGLESELRKAIIYEGEWLSLYRALNLTLCWAKSNQGEDYWQELRAKCRSQNIGMQPIGKELEKWL